MAEGRLEQQAALVGALAAQLRAAGLPVALYETHVSWVLVAGADAYKIKKALRLEFLDYATLGLRRHYCAQEVALNAALAPGLYLGVAEIGGSPSAPRLGAAPAIEVAVHMRAFPQSALWSERLAHGQLGPAEIDQFAVLLARFHAGAARVPLGSPWGEPAAIDRAGERNVDELLALAGASAQVEQLGQWRRTEAARLAGCFAQRRRDGAIRACHGDLHCANILTLDGAVMAFDCIEFDDSLRWIDVLHDLAFTLMDLHQRGQARLAARLLNGYLEQAGDVAGLAVLRYYVVECALVRAKVALLRARQNEPLDGDARRALDTALAAARPRRGAVLVMHGFSGSGKSRFARALVEELGAVQIRSDVERGRTAGVDPHRYDRATSDAVYARLRVLAGAVVDAGYPVIVDACHLARAERDACARLADEHCVPWLIVDVRASPATMRARIAQRRAAGGDPSEADEAVLALQLRNAEPLAAPELARTVVVDSEAAADIARLRRELERLLAS